MIRSWGFYRAWKDQHEFTVSLDDDVVPLVGVDVFDEYLEVFDDLWPLSPYLSVGALTDSGQEMRGFPYGDRLYGVAVQYGGWHGVPDLDGGTQMLLNLAERPVGGYTFAPVVLPVPYGTPVTCCAMNFAFRTEYTKFMWQLALVDGQFKRWGDIWSGLAQKHVMDAAGKVMMINGRASVMHDRASDAESNRDLEAPGIPPNEWVRERIVSLRGAGDGSLVTRWKEATVSIAYAAWPGYGTKQRNARRVFLDARDKWLTLFD